MSSFSCPPPRLGDQWDILLRWMKNHLEEAVVISRWLPGGAKCCQGDPDWRGEGRNERGVGGTGQLGGAWWSRSPHPHRRAWGSWHTCQSSAARARMSLGGHTRSFWWRELVGIQRQGASGLGLRTALPPGLSLRNHYFQTSFSSNIQQFWVFLVPDTTTIHYFVLVFELFIGKKQKQKTKQNPVPFWSTINTTYVTEGYRNTRVTQF